MSHPDRGVRIPRYVNELLQIGPYELDELIVLASVMMIGVISGYIFTGIAAGFVVTYFFTFFKSKNSRGVMLHMLYWYGLVKMKNMWCDTSFAKYWIK